jgi:hypothetical protein
MIDIVSDKERFTNDLKKLEAEFADGKISKRQYTIKKKVIEDKLGTVLAVDNIKRLQGKEEVLTHDTAEEKKVEQFKQKEAEEKEELVKKYVTMPSPKARASKKKASSLAYKNQKPKKGGLSKGKMALIGFLVVAFFVGTALGAMFLKAPSNNTSSAVLTLNESAFPPAVVANLTNTTNTTKVYNTTKVSNTTTVKKTTTTTPTNTNNNANKNTTTNTPSG